MAEEEPRACRLSELGRFNELQRETASNSAESWKARRPIRKPLLVQTRRRSAIFYASCMDEKQINAAGAKPLDPEFARIAALASVADIRPRLRGCNARVSAAVQFRIHAGHER